MRRRVVALAAIAFIVLLSSFAGAFEEPVVGPQVGQKAPDFELPQVGGGDKVVLYEQIDTYDVVILYFFFAAT